MASATTNQSVVIPITLVVSQPVATLLVSQSGLTFTAVAGGAIAPSQTVGILNIGQGAMNWTASATTFGGGNWLSVSPASGTSTAGSLQIPLVTISANTATLAAGTYNGLVQVNAASANNAPQFVTIVLSVLPAGSNPPVLVRPTGLIFATQAGGSSPTARTVSLNTAATGTLGFASGFLTYDGSPWLQSGTQNALISNGTATTINVQPALGSLARGIYKGALTLLFAHGSSQTVNILFVIVQSSNATPQGIRTAAATGCTPTQLQGVQRTLTSNFSASVGWPTEVEAQVTDDCGNAVANATVLATFSNGDPPLALASLGTGIYSATWTPGSASSQVVIQVQASLPPLLPAILPAVQASVGANSSVPSLYTGGIVNAASFTPGVALAPGSIAPVFGQSLATTAGAPAIPLPQTLGGATLNIGGLSAPLFYSSSGQINAQLPFELTPGNQPQVVIQNAFTATVPQSLTIAPAQPGIFATNAAGSGQGAILNAQGVLVNSAAPATAGDVVEVFMTGLGATNPTVASGTAAPSSPPLALVTGTVTATVGGKAAAVPFAGLAPGFAGLYQVNVQIPAGVTVNAAVPLVVSENGVPSNTVTLAVH